MRVWHPRSHTGPGPPATPGRRLITPFGELPNKLAVDMSMAEQHEWLQRPVSRRAVLAPILGTAITPFPWTQSGSAAAATAGLQGRLSTSRIPTRSSNSDDRRLQQHSWAISRADVVATSLRAHHSVIAPATLPTVRGSAARYARCTLTGRHPGTAYRYDVRVDEQRVSSSTFTTAAESGRFASPRSAIKASALAQSPC